jgi:ribose/xylose/arabinose/galactoside ABC-type transport system permease subunit
MATSAVIATAFKTTDNQMIASIFLACLAFGAAVGLANGYLIAVRKLSPFLATLATMIVLQGLRFLYTGGASSGTLPPGFQLIGRGTVFGFPCNGLMLVSLTVVLSWILSWTTFGRRIYLVGGNPRAAFLTGINVVAVTLGCYVICSVLAALAGLSLVGYVGLVDNWTGRGYELDSIVGAVMGGVAISGGQGTTLGALLGATVLTMLFNLVVLMGMPVDLQYIIKGLVIVGAAALYATRERVQ